MPMAAQNKDGAIRVELSKTTPAVFGKQLLPFLIGGGSGIVSTTMYAIECEPQIIKQHTLTSTNSPAFSPL